MNWKLIFHVLFWISYVTAFWGSFELAYRLWENGLIESPIWSGTFGVPVPHHYILGFVGVAILWVFLSKEDITRAYRRVTILFHSKRPNKA